MGAKTGIEWCDTTVNSTSGCDGCELWNGIDNRHCYAGTLHEGRLALSLPMLYAPNFKTVQLIPGRMMKAAKLSDLRGKVRPEKPWLDGWPRTIFVGDMGDFLSRAVPDEYIINEILGAILSPAGQRHFWFLLTKRPKRLAKIANQIGGLPLNVMAMTTITNQRTANARIPQLASILCHHRGVSAEPLLSRVDLERIPIIETLPTGSTVISSAIHHLNWLIAGGESGPGARSSSLDAFRGLRDQCSRAELPFFFKQIGGENKKKAGRLLDGRTWDEMPEVVL